MLKYLKMFEATRPFSEAEAWGLFRIAALSEAVGWTLLIIGIGIERYHLPGHQFAVPIAGRIHGTIFIAYFGVLIAVYGSLRWSRGKFLVAILAGIPPYGTLVFEQWAAWSRSTKRRRIYLHSMTLTVVSNNLLSAAS
jgi:integral membrane protein